MLAQQVSEPGVRTVEIQHDLKRKIKNRKKETSELWKSSKQSNIHVI